MSVSALPLGAFAWPCKPVDIPEQSFAHFQGSPPSSTSTQEQLGSAPNLSTLPRQTRVCISGNNRTKKSLIGVEAIVRKATGLGGWHWLVLPSGEEIKLQRNALQVIELGPEQTEESSDEEQEACRESTQIEILDRPRIRRPPRSLSPVPDFFKPPSTSRPSSSGSGSGSMGRYHPYLNTAAPASPEGIEAVNLHKLETASLRRYRRVHQLGDVDPSAPKDELVNAVNRHFRNQLVVDESGVLLAFCAALRRRSSNGSGCDLP